MLDISIPVMITLVLNYVNNAISAIRDCFQSWWNQITKIKFFVKVTISDKNLETGYVPKYSYVSMFIIGLTFKKG